MRNTEDLKETEDALDSLRIEISPKEASRNGSLRDARSVKDARSARNAPPMNADLDAAELIDAVEAVDALKDPRELL